MKETNFRRILCIQCGRLLALFVAGIDEKWEDGLWN